LNTDAMAIPRSQAAAAFERWYVLIVMCLVYAINIAARYVVTTVFEPIRLELGLTDAGAAFLTGVPLAMFYVCFMIPIAWLRRPLEPPQHRRGVADHLVGIHGVLRHGAVLHAVPASAASAWVSARRARHRRPGRWSRTAFRRTGGPWP
jgi:hypothetical protein